MKVAGYNIVCRIFRYSKLLMPVLWWAQRVAGNRAETKVNLLPDLMKLLVEWRRQMLKEKITQVIHEPQL